MGIRPPHLNHLSHFTNVNIVESFSLSPMPNWRNKLLYKPHSLHKNTRLDKHMISREKYKDILGFPFSYGKWKFLWLH
ncbi:hypothetical protein EUGRSUZ_F03328 [Eucalyptus grandis]|uniref:Uncharacterized protein n=2 Tax=Eucalyptus grandis TaxID=71139 RepID=A0ACC3KL92_EUCGR|nr:hypothetical protein EUGRSUZ_F03328 [Eucalyptus grandis]